jgi:hypothetical protein
MQIDQKLLEYVLNEINNKLHIDKLPEGSFITGGAIASILSTHTIPTNNKINDIDIVIRSSNELILEDICKIPPQEVHSYATTTYKTGKVNVILNGREENAFRINSEDIKKQIGGYDLNCCQCAYEIKTKQFITTENFDKFLETKKIEQNNDSLKMLEKTITQQSHKNILRRAHKYQQIFNEIPEDLESQLKTVLQNPNTCLTATVKGYTYLVEKYNPEILHKNCDHQSYNYPPTLIAVAAENGSIRDIKNITKPELFQEIIAYGKMTTPLHMACYHNNAQHLPLDILTLKDFSLIKDYTEQTPLKLLNTKKTLENQNVIKTLTRNSLLKNETVKGN